jgi:hypothetical protein
MHNSGFHQKSLQFESSIDAKAFCNYFTKFYGAGRTLDAFKLLRFKTIVSTVGVTIPFNEKNMTTFQVSSRNDMKQGFGQNIFTLTHMWNYSQGFQMQTQYSNGREKTFNFTFIKHLWNRAVEAQVNLALIIPQGIAGPSVSFTFKNLRPYTLNFHTAIGQGFGFNIEKGISDDGSSNMGYKLDFNVGEKNVTSLLPLSTDALKTSTSPLPWALNSLVIYDKR